MASQNFVKCSISKIVQYQDMLSLARTELLKAIESMENGIKKVSQSWQDDVFESIKMPLQKADVRLQRELEELKTQVMTRLKVQEAWLIDYGKTAR